MSKGGGIGMNTAEFQQLLRMYERDVYAFCRYLAMDVDVAADLYQDTVLAAFQRAKHIDEAQNPRAFLFAIAAGLWRNIKRKAGRRQAIAPTLPLEEAAHVAAGSGGPAEALHDKQQRESIAKALNRLDDKWRVPLILHYFDDWPLADIAQITGIPKGTVKSRLHKARTLLKETLEKEGFTYE